MGKRNFANQNSQYMGIILTSRRTFTRLRLPDAGGFGDFHAAVPLRILLLRFNGDKFQPPQGRMRF